MKENYDSYITITYQMCAQLSLTPPFPKKVVMLKIELSERCNVLLLRLQRVLDSSYSYLNQLRTTCSFRYAQISICGVCVVSVKERKVAEIRYSLHY